MWAEPNLSSNVKPTLSLSLHKENHVTVRYNIIACKHMLIGVPLVTCDYMGISTLSGVGIN